LQAIRLDSYTLNYAIGVRVIALVCGGKQTLEYKVYYLDDTGRIARGPEGIDAKSDDEALALIQARKLSVGCEVWDQDRLVGRVPPHGH
jgi:hypothetical protein